LFSWTLRALASLQKRTPRERDSSRRERKKETESGGREKERERDREIERESKRVARERERERKARERERGGPIKRNKICKVLVQSSSVQKPKNCKIVSRILTCNRSVDFSQLLAENHFGNDGKNELYMIE
jgi:hypothetical protein